MIRAIKEEERRAGLPVPIDGTTFYVRPMTLAESFAFSSESNRHLVLSGSANSSDEMRAKAQEALVAFYLNEFQRAVKKIDTGADVIEGPEAIAAFAESCLGEKELTEIVHLSKDGQRLLRVAGKAKGADHAQEDADRKNS